MTSFYEAAKVMYPLWYQNYPFERWIGFLESFNLILRRESRFFITIAGRDFLTYPVDTQERQGRFMGDAPYRLTFEKDATKRPPQLRGHHQFQSQTNKLSGY